ncbi:hypothetical protein ACWDX6_07165 [Streptomyces sp. NPDC003027]
MPGPSEPVGPSRSASLAGRPAGEGRERPGRPASSVAPVSPHEPDDPSRTSTATSDERPDARDEPDEDLQAVPPGDAAPPSAPSASRPAAAHRAGAEAGPTSADQQVPVLTLGAGLALVGLGIGFLGIRMRRR